MHVHLDAIGGVAGDMFLAAMLDARPDLVGGTLKAIRAAGLPKGWTAEAVDHLADGLTGRRFYVVPPAHGVSHHHPHEHHHHVAFRDIRAMFEKSALDSGVKARAIAIFRLLAEAEGAVHGQEPEDVHFHEVADWDSVADIVGAAFVIEALGGATWSVSALPLGGGRVKTAHGMLPVPAPATARLLEGFEMLDDGIAGERITPTGAVILKALAPTRRRPTGAVLAASGTGFGARTLPGLPNILRALLFETGAAETTPGRESEVAVIAFEVDDQTPEDLAAGLDKLRAEADVLDVTQAAVFGKKGRLMMAVQLLCRAPAVERVAAACFAETTTIGLRWHLARRFELDRRAVTAGGVRVKVVSRPGSGATAKAEMDDIREVPGGQAGRAAARGAAEAGALRDKKTKD
ncbi:MAG: LarC family nickel insertion protein [Rhodospirillales bacterium]|nr:LarC family nickel insertion protein [Rhodospirillales bacterium]